MTNSETNNANFKPIPDTKDSIALAIRQPNNRHEIPEIIAGGKGRIAEQIIQIAFQNGIKVREDEDLVEILSSIDLETEIPIEAFAAIAEILSYIYALNNSMHSANSNDSDETENIEKKGIDSVDEMANELVSHWLALKESPI